MINLPCPSCGGELTFRSKQSIFAVCPYCQSNVIKHDVDLEKIGEMAELPQDMSPIQLGTTGVYKGVHFYVSGRIIYHWEDGTWNEWHLYFDDGKTGWLSEAQGEFAITFPLDMKIYDAQNYLKLGKELKIEDENFKVSDIKEVSYLGSEGELPFKAEADYQSTVIDFSNEDHKFLTIEMPYEKDEKPLVYKGTYVKFLDLKPQNIRIFEGWT